MQNSESPVALVTGASSGLGRSIALALARRGARLVIVARREDRLRAVAAEAEGLGAKVEAIPCDVSVRSEAEGAVAAVIERFGRLDVLINNAGRGHFASIEETPSEQIESIFRVNTFALWYTCGPAVARMRAQRSGHIINIASIAGKIGYPANAAYVAAKHAAVGFTRALRAELAGSGVEATVVIPAGVLTEWALVTEGGGMLDLFEYEGRRGLEIAAERGIVPAAAFPLLSPDEVAERIVAAIGTPVPELHTHPGTREFTLAYETDQRAAERSLEPFWLANREGYERMKEI